MQLHLTADEKSILLETARKTISARLSGGTQKPGKAEGTLAVPCGAFVTLRKRGSLRGCIGLIAASKPLLETVREMAEAAAFDDPRFPSLEAEELKDVDIEISVLSPFTRIEDPRDVRVGEHGIMMRLGGRSGLLLPQVATEQGWDRETFLTQTCYKAGLPGDAWKSGAAHIEVFTAIVFGERET